MKYFIKKAKLLGRSFHHNLKWVVLSEDSNGWSLMAAYTQYSFAKHGLTTCKLLAEEGSPCKGFLLKKKSPYFYEFTYDSCPCGLELI